MFLNWPTHILTQKIFVITQRERKIEYGLHRLKFGLQKRRDEILMFTKSKTH